MNPHATNDASQAGNAPAAVPPPHSLHSPQALSPLAPKQSQRPDDSRTSQGAGDTRQHGPELPPGTGKLGMWLFLAALFMLFAASIVSYAVIRITGSFSPPTGSVTMPVILWGSTLAMLASSVTMHMALTGIKRNNMAGFKTMMLATLGLAVLFLAMQAPGLYQLLSDHYAGMESQIHIYGLLFVLVLLHAAHILGGLTPLAISTLKAQKNTYTQQDHNPITYLAMYWHFLDGVWVVMFGVFLILG